MNYYRLLGCMWTVFLTFFLGWGWLIKAHYSKNYMVNLQEWHKELESSIFTRPLFNAFLKHVLCGRRDKLGW